MIEKGLIAGNDMSEFMRAKIGECARWRGDIAPLQVPTGLEVGPTQESVPDETVVVSDASGIGMWEEEQTMSPVLIGDVETVLAGFGLERRPLKQSLAIAQKSFSAMQILQRPDKITILYGSDHEVRHVRMDRPHPAQVTPSWYGDSVGHYEGDTLVIDTVGFKIGPFSAVDQYGTPYTQSLHVVERYRLIDYEAAREAWERGGRENIRGGAVNEGWAPDPNYKGKALQLQFTVEDEGVFTAAWSATKTYRRVFRDWPERVCAENPYKYGTEKDAAVPTAVKPEF
jgi:hypothetical protein